MKDWIKCGVNWGKRAILLLIYDVVAINLASIGALMLRFDFSYSKITDIYLERMYAYIPMYTICTVIIFYLCRMYHSLWLYASINELWNIACGCMLAVLTEFIGMSCFGLRMPYSYYPLSFLVLMFFIWLMNLMISKAE